jgi:hypothetical protein
MCDKAKPGRGNGAGWEKSTGRAGNLQNTAWAPPVQLAPGGKFSVTVLDFKAVERGSLRGFANASVKELHLVCDVAIHERDGPRWAQLRSKPQLDRNGKTVRDPETGRVKYIPVVQFGSRKVADAFSARVLKALDVHQGRAL